ncbi:MAG: NTP transferase domain-containing protein [Bacteroidota bacterium]
MAGRTNIKSLILAGGKSSRMGTDKSQLVYHGQNSQQIHLANLCKNVGLEVYVSKEFGCREKEIEGFSVMVDRLETFGPILPIIWAMESDPEAAWLVLACDLPLWDQQRIEWLVRRRNPNYVATVVQGKERAMPEPLICIYEPSSLPRLKAYQESGRKSPRKFLLGQMIERVIVEDRYIMNANTPEERQMALDQLKSVDEDKESN